MYKTENINIYDSDDEHNFLNENVMEVKTYDFIDENLSSSEDDDNNEDIINEDNDENEEEVEEEIEVEQDDYINEENMEREHILFNLRNNPLYITLHSNESNQNVNVNVMFFDTINNWTFRRSFSFEISMEERAFNNFIIFNYNNIVMCLTNN